jgi:hypothetical protein
MAETKEELGELLMELYTQVGIQEIQACFPRGKPYTDMEALMSLHLDYFFENHQVTVTGYSKQWKWSKDRVYGFLKRCGLEIVYPESTKNTTRQRGWLRKKTDQNPTRKRLINFFDIKNLQAETDQNPTRTQSHLKINKKKSRKKPKKVEGPLVKLGGWWKQRYQERFKKPYVVGNAQKFYGVLKSMLNQLGWEDLQYIMLEFMLDDSEFLFKGGHGLHLLPSQVNKYREYQDPRFREEFGYLTINKQGGKTNE